MTVWVKPGQVTPRSFMTQALRDHPQNATPMCPVHVRTVTILSQPPQRPPQRGHAGLIMPFLSPLSQPEAKRGVASTRPFVDIPRTLDYGHPHTLKKWAHHRSWWP
ncbi:hypothetical protein BXT84_00795 [Sulfobacillus thermotolerans]|uniref:Uncharacterized protein n=1 Tax=Sulfobacillus thermotolerans TaxID=338644 RepID=A0ABM6RMW3_9FIRM|nr:hypothetical protein BXT84_00795 [Sulfobacillus thermotolerans]